jgi:hypothetical protein
MLKVMNRRNSMHEVIFIWSRQGVNEGPNITPWWSIYLGWNACSKESLSFYSKWCAKKYKVQLMKIIIIITTTAIYFNVNRVLTVH